MLLLLLLLLLLLRSKRPRPHLLTQPALSRTLYARAHARLPCVALPQSLPLSRALEVLGIAKEQWERELGVGNAQAERLVTTKWKARQLELNSIYGQTLESDQNPLKVNRISLLNAAKGQCDRALASRAKRSSEEDVEGFVF